MLVCSIFKHFNIILINDKLVCYMFATHIENKITMNIFYKTTMKTKQFNVDYHHYQSDNYNEVYIVSVVCN